LTGGIEGVLQFIVFSVGISLCRVHFFSRSIEDDGIFAVEPTLFVFGGYAVLLVVTRTFLKDFTMHYSVH